MNAIFKKLNFKDQSAIYVLNAPASFHLAMNEMRLLTDMRIDLAKATEVTTFALAFTTTKRDLDAFSDLIAKITSSDAVVWVAYPKSSSKNYHCEFNRDPGWDARIAKADP